MQEFEFEVWKVKNPKTRNIIIASTLILTVIFIFVSLIFDSTGFTIFLLSFTPIIGIIVYHKITKYEYYEVVIFTDSTIVFQNNTIEYADVIQMKLLFHTIKGDNLLDGPRSLFLALSKGKENEIIIITSKGKIALNIFLKHDYDYIQLKHLYHFLKEKDVNVKAKGFNEKMDAHPYGGNLR